MASVALDAPHRVLRVVPRQNVVDDQEFGEDEDCAECGNVPTRCWCYADSDDNYHDRDY